MSITLKSLIFILIIAISIFWIASFVSNTFVSKKEFNLWRNLWVLVQSVAFFAPNIWFFYGVLFCICTFLSPKTAEHRLPLFCLLLCSLPTLPISLPGFGIINYFFDLRFPRALTLFLLLPIYFLNKQDESHLFYRSSDKYIVMFLLLAALLAFRDNTFTNFLRSAFYIFIDYFLLYYVFSRNITKTSSLNKVLFALVLSISISACIGLFESIKSWRIYHSLVNHLLNNSSLYRLDIRSDVLRSSATFSSPIILGYVITIALGITFYLFPLISNKQLIKKLLFFVLCISLLSTVSRGPWVGFAFLCIIFLWTGKRAIKNYTKILFAFLLFLPVLLFTGTGQKFVDTLPFIGTTRSDTVDYRERLFDMSMIVIKRHPFFGSTTYMETPEMLSMMQGQGIIDIVNSYLRIALSYGSVGLLLFISIFITLLFQIKKTLKLLPPKERDMIRLGRMLFSILCAIMLIISTVSSIDYAPYYYWLFFALATAYIRIEKQKITIYKSKNAHTFK